MIVLDTSAFVKRYVPEKGASEVADIVAKTDHIGISRLVCIEFNIFVNRSLKSGTFDTEQLSMMLASYDNDLNRAISVLPLSEEIARETEVLSRSMVSLPLRAADALHIQTALYVGAEVFVTADKQQARAAEALGQKTHLIDTE